MKKILDLLGILNMIKAFYYIYKKIDDKTKTELISNEAFRAITNPITSNELRKEIKNYHKTGYWNIKKLHKILN